MRNTVIVVSAVSRPVRELSERDVRIALGMSADAAARCCGVSRNTLKMWELDPSRATERVRAQCARFYAGLRKALESAPGRSS